MSWEILLLGLFGAGGWYWYAGMQVREQAIAVGRRACNETGLQFLDESVALSRIRFARNSNGQLQFLPCRAGRAAGRNPGGCRRSIRMLGERVEWVSLDGEWRPGQTASVSRLVD